MPTFRTRLRDSQGNVVGVGERAAGGRSSGLAGHQVALDKALVALKLLDHPAITPGMDEWSFVQTRLNRNIIDP